MNISDDSKSAVQLTRRIQAVCSLPEFALPNFEQENLPTFALLRSQEEETLQQVVVTSSALKASELGTKSELGWRKKRRVCCLAKAILYISVQRVLSRGGLRVAAGGRGGRRLGCKKFTVSPCFVI